jgi:hypothetical protein
MNSPDRKIDSHVLQRFSPGQHVLVNAIDERAIQVEEKRSSALLFGFSGFVRALALPIEL